MEREPEQQDNRKRERGATIVEYALLLALVAIVAIVAVTAVGTNLNDSYTDSNDSIFSP